MSNTPEVWRGPATMTTRSASTVKGYPSVPRVNRLAVPAPREPGRACETTSANDSLPYHVELFGKSRRYQSGRDALAFARQHNEARVYFTAPRTVHLDYADQLLPRSDKAKPPKGSCGTFAKGQTTKLVTHHVSRENVTTRIY